MPRAATVLPRCLFASALGLIPAGLSGAEEEPFWRPDTPRVLEPATTPADEAAGMAVAALFGEAWRAAGSPRLAILWERTLDDRLSDFETSSRLVVSRESRSGDDAAREETTVRVETAADAPRRSLAGIDRLRFEAGFSRPFLEVGATLVDRAVAMRLLHAEQAPESASHRVDDRQWVETEALRAYADMILQISTIPAKGGVAFRVAALDLRTGAVGVDLFADDLHAVPEGEGEWRAAPGGFVRVREAGDVDFEDMGHALALRTMEELHHAWR